MRIILLGVTALLFLASCNRKTENVRDYNENKENLMDYNENEEYLRDYNENEEYLIELEKIVEEMTEQQKQQFIIDGEEVMKQLQKEIESDSIDPETRFQKIRSLRLIKDEQTVVINSLL